MGAGYDTQARRTCRRRAASSHGALLAAWWELITPFKLLWVLRLLPQRTGTTLRLDSVTPEAALLHMLRWNRLPVLLARR